MNGIDRTGGSATHRSAILRRPIFVVGAARSGTTFIGEVLKSHPNIHCLLERPEPFKLASWLAQHPDTKLTDRAKCVGLLRDTYATVWRLSMLGCRGCSRACRRAAGISRRSFSSCVRRKPVLRFADKSHQHVLNASLLLEAFPEAQFVHVVRDGRDVVASMLKHPGVLGWHDVVDQLVEWPQPWFGLASRDEIPGWRESTAAAKCARRWASWVEAGIRARSMCPEDQWMDVRYEDLVTRPMEVGRNILRFLGVEPTSGALSKARASSIGAWRTRLSAAQLADVMCFAAPVLEGWGYDLDCSRADDRAGSESSA